MNTRKHICSDTAFLVWHIILNVFTSLYFLPASIGYARYHRNRTAIFWLTTLTAWSGIGWIAALVWSLTDDRIPVEVSNG